MTYRPALFGSFFFKGQHTENFIMTLKQCIVRHPYFNLLFIVTINYNIIEKCHFWLFFFFFKHQYINFHRFFANFFQSIMYIKINKQLVIFQLW